jgi:hypothetical protein
MNKILKTGLFAAILLTVLIPMTYVMAQEDSPFIVGVWKFVPVTTVKKAQGTPQVDTEFRFINPTKLTLYLEYAFFDLAGNFCGCDRDVLDPNKTAVYTVLGESQIPSPVTISNIPNQFSCTGDSGALKAIVFTDVDSTSDTVIFGSARQVGFQTHVLGHIKELGPAPNFNFLQGDIMTTSEMKAISIDSTTAVEINQIHKNCVTVQGPVQPH